MTRRLILLGALFAFACGSEPASGLPDAGSPSDAGPTLDSGTPVDAGISDAGFDPTAPWFEPDRILEVEIELAPTDWDVLRAQTRTIQSLLTGADCLSEPFLSPYTYFVGKATIDGEAVEQVGVRKKGFIGSLSETRPSLKIKFDEFVLDQYFHGFERMTFNNARQDPAIVRQCIAYELFRKAGMPASRCNYAHVTVNGEDLGVYVHVESVKKRFLRRHFDDDEGLLYEGTLSDFRDGWLGTFEKKTNKEEPDDRARLTAVSDALERPDAELVEALEAVIDVDAFLTFWAMEVLIAHWDGYAGNTNNFFIYSDPLSDRFYFIPWGVDGVLQNGPFLPDDAPNAVLASGLLARRLYELPEIRTRYLARLDELLTEVWNEVELNAYVDSTRGRIATLVQRNPMQFEGAISDVKDFIAERRSVLRPEIDAGGLDWPVPLRNSPCFSPIGTLSSTVTTTWGTHPSPNLFNDGAGEFSAFINGNDIVGMPVGAAAGMGVNPDDMHLAILLVGAFLPDQSIALAYLAVDPSLIIDGAEIPVASGQAALLRAPGVGQEFQIVGWLDGTLFIDRGATTIGAPIEARLDVDILTQGL